MGVVYKARDVLLNRTAALKFLPADSADADDKRHRFLQEAQSASALNHPNIITIYEVANAGERDFIAMELVQGQPLDQVIGRKGLPLRTRHRLRHPDRRCAGRRARRRHRPSRSQAGQRDGRRLGTGQGARLRPRQADARRRERLRRDPNVARRTAPGPLTGPSSAPWPTCRRSKPKASRWIIARTSFPSARCSTKCSPAVARSRASRPRRRWPRSSPPSRRRCPPRCPVSPPSWPESSRGACESCRRSAGRASPTSGLRSRS